MTAFKHPEEAMRARMLGIPITCTRCIFWYTMDMRTWCAHMVEEPEGPQYSPGDRACPEFKLPAPGEEQPAYPPQASI